MFCTNHYLCCLDFIPRRDKYWENISTQMTRTKLEIRFDNWQKNLLTEYMAMAWNMIYTVDKINHCTIISHEYINHFIAQITYL